MVNVAVVIRALGGAAMPVALLVGRMQHRARRDGEGRSIEEIPSSDPVEAEGQAEGLERLSRRKIRAAAAVGDDLSGVDLRRARLGGAALGGVRLRGRDLHHIVLAKADLHDADLCDARLDEADLSGADLRGADLRGASLLEADLSGADLRGADLTGARHISMALLRRSTHDASTRWPSGFDPVAAGSSGVRD